MSRPYDEHELLELLEGVCRDSLDARGWARLEKMLLADGKARMLYRRYVNAHVGLKQYLAVPGVLPRPAVKSPVLGFLGQGLHQVADFCWRATPFSLLVAVALPLACLAFLVTWILRPGMVDVKPAESGPAIVAALGRTCDCRWAQGTAGPSAGESFTAGRRIELVSGLAEITMTGGTTVILEGPATLGLDSNQRVALETGKLTAQVPRQARGFTVGTPSMAIVDLGTEFGVSVEGRGDEAEIEVFRGEVQLAARDARNPTGGLRQRLTVGYAARVERSGPRGEWTVREIAPSADRFVRRLPVALETPRAPSVENKPKPLIVADFADGNGSSKVDQLPGVAGSGWAGAWRNDAVPGAEATATVASDKPLLGGGKYARMAVARNSGAGQIRHGLARRLEQTGQLDITRPHVVCFNLRVDKLGRFDNVRDSVTICSNSKSQDELDNVPSAGWHIRAVGASSKFAPALHWTFCDGDGTGRARIIDSGISVREGAVYSFRVFVDPQARQWAPAVAVDGGAFKQFGIMGMRSSGTAAKRGFWPFLHFRCDMAGGNAAEDRETIAISFDAIHFAQGGDANVGPRKDEIRAMPVQASAGPAAM